MLLALDTRLSSLDSLAAHFCQFRDQFAQHRRVVRIFEPLSDDEDIALG